MIILLSNAVMNTEGVKQPAIRRDQPRVLNLALIPSSRTCLETNYTSMLTLLVLELFACTPWLS
jgi:hypothetical protein